LHSNIFSYSYYCLIAMLPLVASSYLNSSSYFLAAVWQQRGLRNVYHVSCLIGNVPLNPDGKI
jgi:hypothetical protein